MREKKSWLPEPKAVQARVGLCQVDHEKCLLARGLGIARTDSIDLVAVDARVNVV